MTEVQRIVDQMDRAFSGDAWHGPSLKALLEGITAEQASLHPISQAHSVWEITTHIAAWKGIVAQRLRGEKVQVTTQIDWPPVWEASEVEWQRAMEILADSHARIRALANGLRDDQLDEKPESSTEPRYVLLHGVVQHDLYHAGQIAVLKKALSNSV
jgi:uncharacterized damage-inducible protein DinB